jgi:hypothetical protein
MPDAFGERQRRANEHAGRMPHMDKGVPIVEIERMCEETIGERCRRYGCFLRGAPDRSFLGSAQFRTISERDFYRRFIEAGQRNAQCVEYMQLGVGSSWLGDCRKFGHGDKLGQFFGDRWRRGHLVLLPIGIYENCNIRIADGCPSIPQQSAKSAAQGAKTIVRSLR